MSSSIRRSEPLSRTEAISLANAVTAGNSAPPPDDAGDRGFLAFLMIPVEERIGEWRFAGAARTVPEALSRLVDFALEIEMTRAPRETILQGWLEQEVLEVWTDVSKAWSYGDLPHDKIGEHRVLLFGEGQAPYDDFGFAVLEIPALSSSPFQGRAPESARPEGWAERGEDDFSLEDE